MLKLSNSKTYQKGLITMKVKATYGKWGMIMREYLENHNTELFNSLIANRKLISHLNEIDKQARNLWDTIMEQLERKPPTPTPPQGTMEWVQHMNGLRAIADEQVLNDIIYN